MDEKAPGQPAILIIEDSVEVVDFLRAVLAPDYRLYYSLDGQEGSSMAKELRPDLILLDVNLPSKDGFEILEEVRAADSAMQTVVLMLTAISEPQNIVKAFKLGADDYVVKPFNLMELSARIKSHLLMKQMQRQILDMERLKTLHEVAVSFSHEVNNPLMAISAFSFFLKGRMSFCGEDCRKSVDGIMTEVERISDIVKKLSAATKAVPTLYGPGIKMIDLEGV